MMNVLIVEDNPVSSRVLEHMLDKHGYETLTAHDGEQALEYLESHPEIELVITDLVMPKTDGFELVRIMKERPEWSELPILVCTSQNPVNAKDRRFTEGLKYVIKPIRADTLLQKVKEASAAKRKVLQDPDNTMSLIGMDSPAFLEIIDEFSKIVGIKISQLEQQIKESSDAPLDLQDLVEGAKLLRAERVTDILSRLTSSSAKKNPDLIRSMYPVLLRELKATQHYLTLYSS